MRATERKSTSLMTVQRYVMLAVAVILIIITAALLYYRSIQTPLWNKESELIAEAKQASGLTKVDEINKFVWDSTLWIVHGSNEAGEELYVWMNEDGSMLQELKADEGVATDQIRAALLASQPGAEILRIQPGYLDGTPAWEVYYHLGQNDHYSYYSFTDGTLLDQYHLTGKTAP